MDKMTLSYIRYIYKLIGIFFKICNIPIVKTKLLDLYKLQRGECHFMKGVFFFFGGRVSFQKTLKEIDHCNLPHYFMMFGQNVNHYYFLFDNCDMYVTLFYIFLITWISKTSFQLITWVCAILMFHMHHVITKLNGRGGDPKEFVVMWGQNRNLLIMGCILRLVLL